MIIYRAQMGLSYGIVHLQPRHFWRYTFVFLEISKSYA